MTRKKPKIVNVTVTSSRGMRWDKNGRCSESVNGGPWKRRRDRDFGTPVGDLLITPWIQDVLKRKGSPHEPA